MDASVEERNPRSLSLDCSGLGVPAIFRAFRLNADGAVLARCSSPQGILRVDNGNFAEALRAEIGAWLVAGEQHILLCGMIGSRRVGWKRNIFLVRLGFRISRMASFMCRSKGPKYGWFPGS